MTMQERKPRARSGGRSARRALRTAPRHDMLPGLTRGIPLCEVMDGAQVERIDAASMDILENVGAQFRDPIALADWKRVGAKVLGGVVYLDQGLVRELIASIPESFTYHARDPMKNVALGGPHSIFVPMTGAPFLRDLDDVRRNPTRKCTVPPRNSWSMRNNAPWPTRWRAAWIGVISIRPWAPCRTWGRGHYLGHPHTQENFQGAFFMPDLFDNNSIEQWIAEGSIEITERALNYARKLLSEYQEPKLDEAKDEALLDYMAWREREIPAADALNQDY